MLMLKIIFLIMNMNMLMSIMFMIFIHPISMLLIFILFTLNSCIILFLNTNNSLYSLLILISLIGGMMIMFNYFISLINNENLKLKFFEIFILLMFIIYSIFILLLILYMTPIYFYTENMMLNMKKFKINNIYLNPMNYLTIMMIILLLITLTLSFKMSTMKMKSLRKMKY